MARPIVSKRVRHLVSGFLAGANEPNYKMRKPVAKAEHDIAALDSAKKIVQTLLENNAGRINPETLELMLFEYLRRYAKAYSQKRWLTKNERYILGELVRPIALEVSTKKASDLLWAKIRETEQEFLEQFWQEHQLATKIRRTKQKK